MSSQHAKACTIFGEAAYLARMSALHCTAVCYREVCRSAVVALGSSVRVGNEAVVLAGISVGPPRRVSAQNQAGHGLWVQYELPAVV